MKANIKLDERIETKLDPKGNTVDTKGTGKITIVNPSQNTTLWAITLSSTHGPEVVDFNDQSIPHIQPNKPFEDDYKLTNDCKLILKERIDTLFNNQGSDDLNVERNTLIAKKKQQVLFEIQLLNKYDFPLKNVVVKKTFAECGSEINPIPPFGGTFEAEENELVWKLEHVDANSENTLLCSVVLEPTSSEKVKTGPIVVTSEGTATFSDLKPAIDAECDNVDLSVDVKETDQPSMWKVTCDYKNESEFNTMLETVKVGVPEELFINESINSMYKPNIGGVAWSKTAEIKSLDYPQVSKEFKYQVDHDVSAINSILIEKETDLLNVVEITTLKTFDPAETNTYTRSPIKFMIEVTNAGTANIGRLTFDEIIPPYVLVKSVNADGNQNFDITSKLDGQDTLDLEIPANMAEPRKLFVDVKTRKFAPATTFTLLVDCIAEKPKPNLDYSAPSIVNAFAEAETHSFEYESMKNMSEKPELIVVYKTRSFKFNAKYQNLADNEYEIAIKVENNGAVPLENIYVTQPVGTATYKSHEPVTVTAETKNTDVVLYIKAIKVGETVDIRLNVDTTGPIRQIQPSVRVAD